MARTGSWQTPKATESVELEIGSQRGLVMGPIWVKETYPAAMRHLENQALLGTKLMEYSVMGKHTT